MSKLPEKMWEEYIDWLEDYEYEKLGLPRPDKVIFLDMPEEISQKLLSMRYGGDESKKDIHEKNAQYLSRCRKAALFSSEKLGWKILDCSDGDKPKTIDEIYSEIVTLIEEAL